MRGFTLVETVLSLAILGIIMASIGAASLVMMRLLPRSDDPRSVALTVSGALEQFESDVNSMTQIVIANDQVLQFYANGLDGDGPVLVNYKIDQTENRLLRSLDNATPSPCLTGIDSAEFSYFTSERPHPEITEPEPFASDFGTGGFSSLELSSTIESNNAVKQDIALSFDDDVSSWRIESITLRMKRHTMMASGTCRVMFYRVNDDNSLGSTPIRQLHLSITGLTYYSFSAATITYEVSDMPWLEPDERIAVVIQPIGGAIRVHLATIADFPPFQIYDTSNGDTTDLTGYQLFFRLGGSVMRPGDEPMPMTVVESLTFEFKQLSVSESFSQYAKPLVPIVFEP